MFSHQLKNIRKEWNLTQKELADSLNIAQSTIAMYENGKREPDTANLNKIADFFKVTTDFLLGRSHSPKLTAEEEIDIAVDLERTIEQLRTNKGLKFDGEPIDEETILYLKASLEKSIRLAKEITKDKFIK